MLQGTEGLACFAILRHTTLSMPDLHLKKKERKSIFYYSVLWEHLNYSRELLRDSINFNFILIRSILQGLTS